jgi:plastocyanin
VYLFMRLSLLVPAAAVAALALSSCGSDEPTTPAAAPVPDDGYLVQDYTFTPITASPGQVVRVLDGDDEPHTVTAEDGSFDTGSFDKTEPGTFTAPTKPGTYAFICSIHPSMHGTLTVR